MPTSKTTDPPSPHREEEPDAELSELVESLQKIQAIQHQALPSSAEKTLEHVVTEIDNLRSKQAMIQEQIDKKKNEMSALRETLLVVNGALQGLQHVQQFMTQEAAPAASASPPEPST